jgi:hypothetical protein
MKQEQKVSVDSSIELPGFNPCTVFEASSCSNESAELSKSIHICSFPTRSLNVVIHCFKEDGGARSLRLCLFVILSLEVNCSAPCDSILQLLDDKLGMGAEIFLKVKEAIFIWTSALNKRICIFVNF